MKCIFKYLKGRIDIELVYHGDMSCAFACYSNSDYGANLDAKRSVTRYAFTIGNFLVSWKATLQSIMTLSITEVEYMVLAKTAKEGIKV